MTGWVQGGGGRTGQCAKGFNDRNTVVSHMLIEVGSYPLTSLRGIVDRYTDRQVKIHRHSVFIFLRDDY